MFFFVYLLRLKVLLGIVVWVGSCGLFELIEHLFRPFWFLESPMRSHVILTVLLSYVTWSFSLAAFQYSSSVLYMLCFDYYVSLGKFFSGPVYLAFYMLLVLDRQLFFRVRKSSMVLLGIFSVPLTWVSSLFSMPSVLIFEFFMLF